MNAPLVKNPRSGSHAWVLIRELSNEAKLSSDVAWNVSIRWLPGSRRLSSQMA